MFAERQPQRQWRVARPRRKLIRICASIDSRTCSLADSRTSWHDVWPRRETFYINPAIFMAVFGFIGGTPDRARHFFSHGSLYFRNIGQGRVDISGQGLNWKVRNRCLISYSFPFDRRLMDRFRLGGASSSPLPFRNVPCTFFLNEFGS